MHAFAIDREWRRHEPWTTDQIAFVEHLPVPPILLEKRHANQDHAHIDL